MMSAPLWSNIFAWSDPGMTSLPLRNRFPFFDLRLVLYALTVPPVPWFENKFLLREAMRDALPEAVYRRPKTSLRGNPHQLLAKKRGLQDWMTDLLAIPTLSNYIDKEKWLDRFGSSPSSGTYNQLGLLLSFAYWLGNGYHLGSTSPQDPETES